MQISLKTIVLILIITTKVYCQTSPLCPKYDSTRKAWAFVDCKTQKQVFVAEYKQATIYEGAYYNDDYDYYTRDKKPYFWSKFNADSLKVLDSIGNTLMAISKQGLPLIEYLAVKNPELFEIYWEDINRDSWKNKMLINNKGKIWKPTTISNVLVNSVDSIGNDKYIAFIMEYITKDSLQYYGQMLVDKQCNPLSKLYGWIRNDSWGKVELIQVTNKETQKMGYIDFNGKTIIPELYTIHNYFENNYIILEENKKQGVLDIEGKTILPFIYHEIRQLKNGFFVVKDTNGISNEYVVNAKGEHLTKPVFCQIDSFADGKVWQKWSNKTLLYNSKGQCLSSEIEVEEAGFMVFLQDTKTKILYSQYSDISDKIREFEVILQTPNVYSYKVLQGHFTCRGGRRSFRMVIDNKINLYHSDSEPIFLNREFLNIDKLSIKNTKTNEEKILDKQLYYNFIWHFYRD
jgi:hypothetical protein